MTTSLRVLDNVRSACGTCNTTGCGTCGPVPSISQAQTRNKGTSESGWAVSLVLC